MTRPQTHYEILSLPTSTLITPTILKKAYHRALLLHHPDKTTPSTKSEFTVDQITTAYNVLSTPHLRAGYDKELSVNGGSTDEGKVLQVVDLDDFSWDEVGGRWTRSCRCGEEEGYVVTEEDLDAGDDVVGCCGCSLWVRVGYEVVYEGQEDIGEECVKKS